MPPLDCSGEGGGGVADALRDVQLQERQLLAQEERRAAQAAADAAAELEGGGEDAQSQREQQQRQGAADDDVGGEGELEDSAAGMLAGALALLDQAQSVVEGAEERVLQYGQLYRFSQADYDDLSARLQQLERLCKQHDATSADELLEAAERQGAALDAYFQLEGQRGQLEGEAQRLLLQVREQAVELSQWRREAAGQLRAAVEAVLSDLAMAGSRFDVRIAWTPAAAAAAAGGSGSSSDSSSIGVPAEQAAACYEEAGQYRVRSSGLDTAEFLFAAGPAEPLRPLSAVASGGESARIMLALKAAPAFMLAAEAAATADGGSSESSSRSSSGGSGGAADGSAAAASAASSSSTASSPASSAASSSSSQIMVLDEIDSGIGSRLGAPIGRILRRMAGPAGLRVGQILCVSHLPQVGALLTAPAAAAAADCFLASSGQPASRPVSLPWPRPDTLPANPSVCLLLVPQVAAHAEHHLCVRKAVGADDRVVTQFDALQQRPERLAEISAMLGLPAGAAEQLMAAAAAGQP